MEAPSSYLAGYEPNQCPMNNHTEEIYTRLGANEKSIIDKIHHTTLRHVAIRLIDIKVKLQWSGWLQYLIPLPIVIILLLIAALFFALDLFIMGNAILICDGILFFRILFDIITVKFRIRFPESKPKGNQYLSTFDLIHKRHSCRSYQTRKISESDLQKLLNSVLKHLDEPKWTQQEIRLEYISAPLTVWPVVNATQFLVAIAPKEYNRHTIMEVGRTLQKIVIDATRINLATCWIGPGADQRKIALTLQNQYNPNHDHIICVCAFGYQSKYSPLFISFFSKRMRQRLSKEKLFFKDTTFKKPIDYNKAPYTSFERSYEACQWAPSSYNGQTTRAVVISNQDKVERVDFYTTTKSKYYAALATGIWCANWEIGCSQLNIKGSFTHAHPPKVKSTDKQVTNSDYTYEISWVPEAHF